MSKKELYELNKSLLKYRKYAPKRRIADAVNCSLPWVSAVFNGSFEDDQMIAVAYEVIELCKELAAADIEKAKQKARERINADLAA